MSRDKKEVTIYDIATQLNISVATVSRALRNDPVVSDKTKKKIFELSEKYGYQTNQFARNLRKQQTNTIGVIIPRLNSYFMAAVIAGIEQVASKSDYNLIISQSSESTERESMNIRTMFNNRVDGLLVSLSFHTNDLSPFEKFAKKNIPVIFFDRTPQSSTFAHISINNVQAGYEATKHLLAQGRRRIVHVTVSSTESIYRDRFQGYAQALAEFSVPLDMNLIYLGDLSLEAGADAAKYILSFPQRPDGVFVSNDNCAAGCVIGLKALGLRIPEDIAVVGFNDDPVSRIVEPNLTTIHYPGHEMGELAARSLINHLNGASDIMLTQTILLRSDLVVRRSTEAGAE
jgi:LacI family transcriptional regulator